MAYIEANGQRLHYHDTESEGPAILFSHGFMMDREMWTPQLEKLGDRYRCITWDERGWGQTVSSGGSFDCWDSAADAVALLDGLGIDRAVWVGMSQGGFLSMRAALAHPDRVVALVLIDTSPYPETLDTAALFKAMFDQTLETGTGDDIVEAVCAMLFGPDFDATRWRAKMTARPPVAMRDAFSCMVDRDDISHRLGDISCPTLVLHGEMDAVFGVDDASAWAAQVPGLTSFVRIPNAGHTANLENSEAANAALVPFLERLRG